MIGTRPSRTRRSPPRPANPPARPARGLDAFHRPHKPPHPLRPIQTPDGPAPQARPGALIAEHREHHNPAAIGWRTSRVAFTSQPPPKAGTPVRPRNTGPPALAVQARRLRAGLHAITRPSRSLTSVVTATARSRLARRRHLDRRGRCSDHGGAGSDAPESRQRGRIGVPAARSDACIGTGPALHV